MKVADIASVIEQFAPVSLQEDYDNCGLLTGNLQNEISGVLITLDVTEDALDEAIKNDCQMIISHHPVVLRSGLKRFTGRSVAERIIIKAIKNNISLYASHTNADMVSDGVSGMMCRKLGLVNCSVLEPRVNDLVKLVTFVPVDHLEKVRQAIFESGAGVIGNYDSCSFMVDGQGCFRGNDTTNPFVGEQNKLHFENEVRIETILPSYLQNRVVNSLIDAHPYEEVAYDLYPLKNHWPNKGLGMVGELPKEISELEFLKSLKSTFQLKVIRHTELLGKQIKKVAVCGGAGSSLLGKAIVKGADIFITGDFKYHQFFDADQKILVADIGHYESEQFTKELFFELLTKKFPNFAIRLSKINSNPIKYL